MATAYDPRLMRAVRRYVDGFYNDLPSAYIRFDVPEADDDLWIENAVSEGLLVSKPSALSAVDGSTVLVVTKKGALAVKLDDEQPAEPDSFTADSTVLLSPNELERIHAPRQWKTLRPLLLDEGSIKETSNDKVYRAKISALPPNWEETIGRSKPPQVA